MVEHRSERFLDRCEGIAVGGDEGLADPPSAV
jgi:hypothetical protein